MTIFADRTDTGDIAFEGMELREGIRTNHDTCGFGAPILAAPARSVNRLALRPRTGRAGAALF